MLFKNAMMLCLLSPVCTLLPMQNSKIDTPKDKIYVCMNGNKYPHTITDMTTVNDLKLKLENQLMQYNSSHYVMIPAQYQTLRMFSVCTKYAKNRSLRGSQLLRACIYGYDTNVFELEYNDGIEL